LIMVVLCVLPCISYGQYIGLEGEVPSNWTSTNGTLGMTNRHYKLGSQSVVWSWNSGAEILINNPKNMNTALNTYKGGVMLWVYNETPIDDEIVVEFSNGLSVPYWFNFRINYKGWRACWLRFKYDMKGPKGVNSLTTMKIKAPTSHTSGKLYFDRMLFPSNRINDRVTPDAQLPYINPDMNTNHWGALYHWETAFISDLPLKSELTTEDIYQLDTFTNNLVSSLSTWVSTTDVTAAKDYFNSLNIETVDGQVKGKPLVSIDEQKINISGEDEVMGTVNTNLYRLAKAYVRNGDTEALMMYIDMMDWLIDQGFDYTSGMGTNHHYGYSFGGFCESILLLKDVLATSGLLDRYSKVATYWAGNQEYRENPDVNTFQGVVDSWLTVITSRLLSVATLPNSPEKYRTLQEMKRWVDESLTHANGTIGGIKPDGTVFHHFGHYPAYGSGGFDGLGKYIKLTRNTIFGLSDISKKNMWKGLKAMVTYCQKRKWGLGISGRHPLGGGQISNGVIAAIGHLAVSGNPDTGASVWSDVGEQYLRFEVESTTNKQTVLDAGVVAQGPYQGAYTFNYAALGIYRQDNWMVTMKGYNMFLWGAEIYSADNRFGRYQSYGTVQVINNGDSNLDNDNGFNENGWDWNRAPGATSIHLPLSLLEAPKDLQQHVGMERFTGYGNLDNQYGLFGMKLREENITNFTPSHQADKSVFNFGRYVVCAGTNISNDNTTYRTETTVFQHRLSLQSQPVVVDGATITSFPYAHDFNDANAHWIIDGNNNGYWIPAGQSIEVRKQSQNSKSNKKKLDTTGDFAVVVLNHGNAPTNQTYQYTILPNTTVEEMQHFAAVMGSANPVYALEQATTNQHVYNANQEGVKGYSFFNASTLTDSYVTEVSSACIMIIKSISENQIKISYTDPDLRIDPMTNTKSTTLSQMGEGIVTLKGQYAFIGHHPNCEILSTSATHTVLQFTTNHGTKSEVTFKKMGDHILIDESFEEAPSASTYQLSTTYDFSNKSYFNRYELSSMSKYYANAGKISGTDLQYIIAGAEISDEGVNPVDITFSPKVTTSKIESLHCSFLLGTLYSPANKFEEADFVRLEYRDKEGVFQPIGQLVGSKWSADAAATNPNYGKLGTDRDANEIIDADINTQYSDNTLAKQFDFEIHNININTLDLRIRIKSDHTYEGIHLDRVKVYNMQYGINISNVTRQEDLFSVDVEVVTQGTLYYMFTDTPVNRITTKQIKNSEDAATKGSVVLTEGETTTISQFKDAITNLYLYMYLEDNNGYCSKVESVGSSIHADSSLTPHLKQNTISSSYRNDVLCIDGLDRMKVYQLQIYDPRGRMIDHQFIANNNSAFFYNTAK
ncbi:chondroitinase family polysaccharide lyase, partial [Prolixibacteraceae bacterium]|nr:chondroitinase family polysaccharide lyase [Prolixibacteraceae bacterium]